MTMSTFSLVISPPLFGGNVRHVGNAERLVAFHGAIDDVDGVGAQHGISQRPGFPGPALDLVLPHPVDELALILRRQKNELLPERLPADVVDRQKRAPIVVGKWRAGVEKAALKQRFLRRYRQLLIDIVGDAGFARLRHQGLAEGLQRFALMAIEQAEWHIACPRLARPHQHFDTADREGQCAQRSAFDKTTPTNACHGLLLPELCLYYFYVAMDCSVLLVSPDNESRTKRWPMMRPRQPARANL